MLVLSRRPQQSLLIGHDVVVTVLEVNGDTVRIGIKAPADVDIHREEIYQDLRQANKAAEAKPGSAAELARRIHASSRSAGDDSTRNRSEKPPVETAPGDASGASPG